MTKRALMLRLDEALAEQVQLMAEVEGRSMSDVIREAIAGHIDSRRRDPEFRRAVKASIDRQRRLLELLAEDDG